MTVEEIQAAALKLPLNERAALAEALLASLDDLTPEELDVLWAKEAQRRWESLQAGTSHTVPAEVVLREAQERIANTERRG